MAPGSEGIDRRATVADVEEAFHRLGADLKLEQQGSRWAASVSATGDETAVLAEADTREDAARQAWETFRERQGGTGTS
jgi:hypothetical protein